MGMDPGIYMLLMGLLIAVFTVIAFFALAVTFRAVDRKRRHYAATATSAR